MRQVINDRSRVSASALVAAAAMSLAATGAVAGGFYVQGQSVKGAGRAYSGEVADTGAQSLWWNPAAIARSPREIYVGAHGRWTSTTVEDEGSTITRPIAPGGFTSPVGGRSPINDATQDDVFPQGAFSLPVGQRFALGVSATNPFHLHTEYGPDAWTRYDTVRNRVDTTNVQATVAMQAAPWLDLGVGVSAQYIDAALDTAYPNLSPLMSDGLSHVVGDSWDYGWTAGAQAHLERLTLGASYRSAIDHGLEGRITLSGLQAPLDGQNFSAPSNTTLSTPWIAAFGARWQATPQLALNAQVQRFGWSEYDAVRVSFGGQTAVIHQDYEDTTSIAVGLDYSLNSMWVVRTGAQFDPTPTPDDLREPGVADSDSWTYGVGATAQLSPNMSLDLALGYVAFQGDRIYEDAVFYEGTPAATTARLRGRIDGDAKTASVGLRWKF